jgi:hypothetical protein
LRSRNTAAEQRASFSSRQAVALEAPGSVVGGLVNADYAIRCGVTDVDRLIRSPIYRHLAERLPARTRRRKDQRKYECRRNNRFE